MIRIRPATLEDAETLWKAEMETAQVPGRLVSRPSELLLPSFENRIREVQEAGAYVVACDDAGICGHAVLDPMGLEALKHVYRLTIVVHPGKTGHGIGTALLSHLQHWARSTPAVRKIELLVRATNDGAIRLYRRFGFFEEGRHRDRVRLPDGTYVDDIAMAWFPTNG
jgi:putative acetyltransferase